MNANEIIKETERILERDEKFMNSIAPHGYGTVGYSKEDDYRRSIIRELSRTRIRVTAEEKPTREDGGYGDHSDYVMARAKGNYWEEMQLIYVAENPDEYPHWTCVPQLPEVTP